MMNKAYKDLLSWRLHMKHSINILVYTFILIIDIIWISFTLTTTCLFPEKLYII